MPNHASVCLPHIALELGLTITMASWKVALCNAVHLHTVLSAKHVTWHDMQQKLHELAAFIYVLVARTGTTSVSMM